MEKHSVKTWPQDLGRLRKMITKNTATMTLILLKVLLTLLVTFLRFNDRKKSRYFAVRHSGH